MKIIITGAGQTGKNLAQHLSVEGHDITLVDANKVLLNSLQEKIDVRTVTGKGSYPYILEQAGAKDADMIIAVTDRDEVNMAICQVAYTMFAVKTKIARIRSPHYTSHKKLFKNEDVPIDRIISPELMITDYIKSLITHPGATQIVSLAKGKIKVISIRISSDSHLIYTTITHIKEKNSYLNIHITAIYRNHHYIELTDDTLIHNNDELFFIVSNVDMPALIFNLTGIKKAYKRIMIAGGGNIGQQLAQQLEENYQVKVIDHNHIHCQQLASTLNTTLVLEGEASDKALLLEENIGDTDIFCAVTNNDESNILSSLLAKSHGAKKVITIANNAGYLDLVKQGNLSIDVLISPEKIIISSLLATVRREYGDIINVHSLQQGNAEAIEIVVKSTSEKKSPLIGKTIAELDIPKEFNIGTLITGKTLLINDFNHPIQEQDHLIIFLTDKSKIGKIKNFLKT